MSNLPRLGQLKYLYPTDLLSMGLSLLFALYSFLNAGKVSASLLGLRLDPEIAHGLLFLLIAACLPLLFRALNGVRNRWVQFFRLFYPQGLYLLFYAHAIVLSQLFYNGRSFDAVFARTDRMIFSFEPALRFHQVFSGSPAVNELFFFAYFSFFAMISVGWWMLYAKGEEEAAVTAFSIVTLSFYLLYLFYPLFPVEGPKYYFASLHRQWYSGFKGYLFTAMLRYLFDHMNLAGAAFPSSHVVISTLALALNLRHNRRLGFAFLPITVLLYFSTVYLYEHYAVDGIAGLIVAALFWWAIPRLLRGLGTLFELCDTAVARLYHLAPLAARAVTDEKALS